jgi:tetratricopeptide (TPR) repeat protein
MPSIRSHIASRVAAALAVAVGWGAAAPAARAQPATDSAPTQPAADVHPEGRRLTEEGLRLYAVGAYREAIEKFKAAYQLEPAPGLLYNLGQAHRLLGDCEQALVMYRRFLATAPTGPTRERAEARIADMERCLAGRAPVLPAPFSAAPPRAPAQPLAAVSSKSEPVSPPPAWKRHVLLASGGASLALAGAGGFFGLRARQAGRENAKLFERGDFWDEAAGKREARGRRDQSLALVLGGAALVTAGTALWLWLRD